MDACNIFLAPLVYGLFLAGTAASLVVCLWNGLLLDILPLGTLEISGGDLSSPLDFNVALSNNNALAPLSGSPTNSLTGSVNRKTGLLSVKFGDGLGKAITVGKGVVLQDVTNAGGFFLGKTNAGSIFLQP
jgi:hypothetical protein